MRVKKKPLHSGFREEGKHLSFRDPSRTDRPASKAFEFRSVEMLRGVFVILRIGAFVRFGAFEFNF